MIFQRFRLLLNDGEYSNSFAMLATQVRQDNMSTVSDQCWPWLIPMFSYYFAIFSHMPLVLSWTIWCTRKPCPSTQWSRWRSWSATRWQTRYHSHDFIFDFCSFLWRPGQAGGYCARLGGAAEGGACGKEDWQSSHNWIWWQGRCLWLFPTLFVLKQSFSFSA